MNEMPALTASSTTVDGTRVASRRARVKAAMARAHYLDALGKYAICGAGVLVLLGVGSILVFLASQAAPLILEPAKHSQGTLTKMFVPQQYSGYQEKQWMWQTEASEGGQEKFGVPLLIWGSLKGALWASLFAMPLAILAALFVSEFASPRQRTWIKSCIELMAGVPTVMVGFFAFVVLSTAMNAYYARHQEYFVNGQWVIFLAQVPLFALTASAIAARLMGKKWRALKKLAAVSVAVLLCLGAVLLLGRGLEWASGSMLKPIFGVTKFMQLNGVLAGFCLGFAIIPVVFSVAEDAMKAVPQSYREASLALGGSRWETALRVVVPAALPGVYAALMLGLARAVGETMIVLMASGNTPILDFSPFTGMRTMAAAIAIETSEKARYSTGFHVLFFVGATLFAMTFVLNSVTDWIIARFKSRYRMG